MARSEVAVLIPAAGQGVRMGGERKQFRLLGGKPLLLQTLLVFERHPDVAHLIVAVPPDVRDEVASELFRCGLTKLHKVVAGGTTRQDSVARALDAVPESADVVLVHDAVRPFIDDATISATIQAVEEHGAAAVAIPVSDTMRYGEGGVFGASVSRDGLFAMQTPQGFRRALFESAHAEAAKSGFQATDDVDLVQRAGYPVRIVPGSIFNLKITTPADWELADRLWAHRTVNPEVEK
jgi:2-C-methyl-D-erythritol 4-phosphate cytidylyltransferase